MNLIFSPGDIYDGRDVKKVMVEEIFSCASFKIWRVKGIFQNTYIVGKKRFFVVDPGVPSSAGLIKKFLEDTKLPFESLHTVIATHFHMDHIGGIKTLFSFCDPLVALHTQVRRYINHNEPQQFPPLSGFLKLWPLVPALEWHHMGVRDLSILFMPGSPYRPDKSKNALDFNVDVFLKDGARVPGFNKWQIIHTPGHSFDSLCVYNSEHGILFTGDTILTTYRGEPFANPFHVDESALKKSLERLTRLKVSFLLPGHSIPVKNPNMLRILNAFTHGNFNKFVSD